MNERVERVVSVEQSTGSQAMNNHFENLLKLGVETAKRMGCIDCTHLALCGIAINTLSAKKSGAGINSMGEIDVNGVHINPKTDSICPRELVDKALRQNKDNEFWLLESDELNGASLETRTAQTVHLAAEHTRQIVSNRIII